MNSVVEQHMTDEYNIKPDVVVDLRNSSVNENSTTKHKHVVIVCEDGSEIWLDIGCENNDHNFADIRWFNPTGEMKGIGVFTIVNGSRMSLQSPPFKVGINSHVISEPLKDTEGTPVTGRGWNGGYLMTLLVDKNGEEKAAIKPSPGNG